MEINETSTDDTIANLLDDIQRLERGIASIQGYLETTPPRVGDALHDCEALLAK